MPATTCPGCGARDTLSPAFPDATRCPGCAAAAWYDQEAPFWPGRYAGVDAPGTVRRFGTDSSVIFAASSSVKYYRGHTQMPANVYTGSAVALLSDLTGRLALAASGSSSQVPITTAPEANFAHALSEQARTDSFVFDIRGIRDRSYDISIGTGPLPDERCADAVAALTRACRTHGLRVSIDEQFGALPPWTVTSFAQMTLGCSAVQVQLAASLRSPQQNPTGAQIVFSVLRSAAAAVA